MPVVMRSFVSRSMVVDLPVGVVEVILSVSESYKDVYTFPFIFTVTVSVFKAHRIWDFR